MLALGKKKNNLSRYFFVLPAYLIMAIVIIYPIIFVISNSFFTNKMGESVFVGIRNYRLAFKDPLFYIALKNNLILFLCVPLLSFLSLLTASLLHAKIWGWRIFQSIIFIPYVLATPVVGIVFSYLLQLNGVVNKTLEAINLQSLAKDWLGNPQLALFTIAGIIIWKQLGFGVVLFLARLMSVDNSLYEAATIDGAGAIQKFWFITIPQTKKIIEFHVIISLIDMLSWVFNYIFVMTGGGPGNKTYVLEFLIYKKAFGGGDMNIAMTYCVVILFIASFLITLYSLLLRKDD
jgi:ABC-type sugar transport system permease subunit